MSIRFGRREEKEISIKESQQQTSETTDDLQHAIEAVLKSYSKHRQQQNGHGKINATESLEEFWQIKLSQQSHVVPSSGFHVVFEEEPGDEPPYVSYVNLPGGSCFGSFEHCQSKADARNSAAKIALMNSVLNEHQSRCITDEFIKSVVKKAQDSEDKRIDRPPDIDDPSKITGAFQFMLTAMRGRSLLEFQELMTIFQLLNWNGTLSILRDKGLSRQHVLSHYQSQTIDNDIREQMALDCVSREQITHKFVAKCYKQVCKELKEFCSKGRELRFVKEKREILALALQHLSIKPSRDLPGNNNSI